jgi:ribosomal protein L32
MAVPFRRKSSTRIKKGRGPKNWAFQKRSFSAQPLINCSSCQKKKILHQVCSHCLVYKGLSLQKPVINQQKSKEE